MAIRIDKKTPTLIEKLPAKAQAEFAGRNILAPRAIFRNAKSTVSCLLQIEATECSICAMIPAELGCHGEGVYYIDFYDGCHLCATQPIELDANCTMVSCEIESVDTGKWPRWKEKKVG